MNTYDLVIDTSEKDLQLYKEKYGRDLSYAATLGHLRSRIINVLYDLEFNHPEIYEKAIKNLMK